MTDPGAAEVADKKPTHFGKNEKRYPDLGEDGSIATADFLRACGGIVEFVGFLGAGFSPVKHDIGNNVHKVNSKFQSDTSRMATLEQLVDADLQDNGGKMGVTTEGLLWLKRGLEFIRVLLELIVEDAESGKQSENLVPIVRQAYEQSLKRHHGFVSKNLFRIVVHAAPWRRDLLKAMSFGQENSEQQCLDDLKKYMPNMGANVDALVKMYINKQLDTPPPSAKNDTSGTKK